MNTRSFTYKNVTVSFGPWLSLLWLDTAYGQQIQFGWFCVAIRN